MVTLLLVLCASGIPAVTGTSSLSAYSMELQSYVQNLQLRNPALNSDCAGKVVAEMLNECNSMLLKEGQNRKVEAAVQLSICEFENAGINYPTKCRDISALECTNILQLEPQWWTTYSNNYNSIGNICLQYRQSYPMEEILKTYEAVFRYQQGLASKLEGVLTEIQERENQHSATLEVQRRYIKDLELSIDRLSSKMGQNKDVVDYTTEELFKLTGMMQLQVESLANDLAQIGNSQHELSLKVSESLATRLQSYFDSFAESSAGIKEDVAQLTGSLREGLNETVNELLPGLRQAKYHSDLVYKSSKVSYGFLQRTLEKRHLLANSNSDNVANTMINSWSLFLEPSRRWSFWFLALTGIFIRRIAAVFLLGFWVFGHWKWALLCVVVSYLSSLYAGAESRRRALSGADLRHLQRGQSVKGYIY